VRAYVTIVLDGFDHFEVEAVQGEAAQLRRLAAAVLNAADAAEKVDAP
jgi:hypothetical protein